MSPTTTSPPPRERILTVAADLFYNQGYRATGINQIIAESGVAKASFYQHFPSKSDLLLAYAEMMADREFEDIQREVFALPTPRERFFGPLGILEPWFAASDYRGCPFQNVMAEMPPSCQTAGDEALFREVEAIRAVARRHRENLRALFRSLLVDLIEADPSLSGLEIDPAADTYLILFEGAIAAAVAYRAPWPVARARSTIEGLLKHHERGDS